MTIAQVQAKAMKFPAGIRSRNLIEYVASVIVVVSFGSDFLSASSVLLRVGSGLVVLGTLVACWELHRRGSARTPPAGPPESSLVFHRAELVRQRDAHRSVWLWYLAPFAPGMLVLMASYAERDGHYRDVAAFLVVLSLLYVGIWQWHLLGARRLQKEIDELDALRGE